MGLSEGTQTTKMASIMRSLPGQEKKALTIRTRKFITNRLLSRKQMVIDIIHPGVSSASRKELTGILADRFKVQNEKCVVLYGFRTAFGGNKSTGFCLIYDTLDDLLDTEPKYRLVRGGFLEKGIGSRKQRRELKNRKKKVRGTKKAKIGKT